MNKKRAFLFWYKCSPTARTEYIWVVAVSVKQAKYLFFKHFKDYYDYNGEVLEVRPLSINYDIGTLLGENSIL